MRISVPASTANLGAGFDCLAMALDERFDLWIGDPAAELGAAVEEGHPAAIAYRRGGGQGSISMRSSIAPGKGMGYSGAAHVAGLAAASLSRFGWIDYPQLLADATELEGHADNAAASIHGGVTVAAGGRAVRLPPPELSVVVWIPDRSTSTTSSRAELPASVPLADAAHNVGASSLFVAALATGDLESLRAGCDDRLHQDRRLASEPESRAALEAAWGSGAVGAWLSGSGPSIAALTRHNEADRVARSLPTTGHTKVLPIARFGVTAHAS